MNYKISDTVSMRMIQIFQEAICLGVDGADLLRQVRLVVSNENLDTLELDPQYQVQVLEMQQKYVDDIKKLKSVNIEQPAVTELLFKN